MDQGGTGERTGTEQPSRALVALEQASTRRVAGGRPLAGFLTQVMVGADQALRPARSARTRMAAALYASADVPAAIGTKPSGVTV